MAPPPRQPSAPLARFRGLLKKVIRRLLILPNFLWLLVQFTPLLFAALYRVMRRHYSDVSEYGQRHRLGYEAVQAREPHGPELHAIPQTTVNDIQEYLEVCQSVERRLEPDHSTTSLYRGQTKVHFTNPSSHQVSLLPSLARLAQTDTRPPKYQRAMALGYLSYMEYALNHHVHLVSPSERGARVLERVVRDPITSLLPGYQELAGTPTGRFLRRLFPTFMDPLLFEAALQHYGFPTLNVDVTYSPLVALYFATHEFCKTATGARSPHPTGTNGSVYILNVRRRDVPRLSDPVPYPERLYLSRPSIADLFDLTFNNDSRARRQYSALLTEVGHVDPRQTPQPNLYAGYVDHVVRLSAEFWKNDATQRFLTAELGGWFFPGPAVDVLYRELASLSPQDFPRYECGALQSRRHPSGEFEFGTRRRIVLTGTDAKDVLTILQPTWFAGLGSLEVMPVPEVMRIAATPEQRERLDVIVVCEADLEHAEAIKESILDEGRRAGRLFVAFTSASTPGTVQRIPEVRVLAVDGLTFVISDDDYDSDFSHQRRLAEAVLTQTRMRYDRRMKPAPEHWETFIDWAHSGTRA